MTGGYGCLGPSGCRGNGINGTRQDSYYSYGGVISRKFDVDSQWVSQSGWGVVAGRGAYLTRHIDTILRRYTITRSQAYTLTACSQFFISCGRAASERIIFAA